MAAVLGVTTTDDECRDGVVEQVVLLRTQFNALFNVSVAAYGSIGTSGWATNAAPLIPEKRL